MLKYALRYAPLLILALLFTLFRSTGWEQRPASVYKPVPVPRPGSEALYDIAMLSSQEAWAVGGTFGLERTTTQGKQIDFAVPRDGLILRYTVNGGWQADSIKGNIKAPLLGISMASSHDGWAVGYNGTFVHYDGNAWSTIPGPPNFNKNVVSVAMLSSTDGWAVGYGGSILHYDGQQWTQVQSPTSFDLRSIAMTSAQAGWAVGDNGTILSFDNGNWRSIDSPTRNALNKISMLSANEGWAVGDNGTILHYRDGVWATVNGVFDASQPISLVGIAMSSVRSGWIIGDGQFLIYNQEIWTKPAFMIDTNGSKYADKSGNSALYSIVLSPSNQGWAVGSADDGRGHRMLIILRYQNSTWSMSPIVGQ